MSRVVACCPFWIRRFTLRFAAKLRTALLLALAAAALFASAAGAQTLTVFAAVSLKDALDEQVQRYGRPVRVAYGASSTLARQIEQAAPAQLFISADAEWMDYLQARRLIEAPSRVNLLSNRLVLVAPAAAAVAIDIGPGMPLARFLGTGRLALADPDHVPAGKYARAALQSLGVWGSVAARVARSENVRAALALVARGEAPLGIVYRTDALVEKRVRIVGEFPATSHPPIVYPAARVAGDRTAAAPQFLAFLGSAQARPVWEKHGFIVLVK